MRQIIISCVVLALISVSANQASAFDWRGPWRGTRHHDCHYRSAATVAHYPQATTSIVTTTPMGAVKFDPVVEMNESVALGHVIDTMRGLLKREHDRLQREIEWLEEDEDDSSSYGSD